jgi:hypothetical protein
MITEEVACGAGHRARRLVAGAFYRPWTRRRRRWKTSPICARSPRPAERARRDEALLTERLALARAHGPSWNRIAAALGVSRQDARQRFGGKVGA